jgi:hypothetical protein
MSGNTFNAIRARPAVVQGTVTPTLTPSNSNVLRFASTTTAASQALPRPAGPVASTVAPIQDWRGHDVEIVNEATAGTDFVFFAFSKGVAVTLVNDASSSTGNPKTTRGEFLGAGQRVRRTIPNPDTNQTGATREDVFFNWIAGANTPNVSMVLVEHER